MEFKPAVSVDIGRGLTAHSIPPPGSGCILTYILNILKHYDDFNPEVGDTPVFYHRIAEAFKWAYAERSKLGDPGDPEITAFIEEVIL